MLLNEYLVIFRKALEKIEDYGFSDSIEIREEIRANKQAVLNVKVELIDKSVKLKLKSIEHLFPKKWD